MIFLISRFYSMKSCPKKGISMLMVLLRPRARAMVVMDSRADFLRDLSLTSCWRR